ncbi:hypothetical protein Ocin01_08482, partial [Orchesella cincta]
SAEDRSGERRRLQKSWLGLEQGLQDFGGGESLHASQKASVERCNGTQRFSQKEFRMTKKTRIFSYMNNTKSRFSRWEKILKTGCCTTADEVRWVIVPGTFAVAVYLFLNLIFCIFDKVCGPKIWPLVQKLRSDKSVEVEIDPVIEEESIAMKWKKREIAVISDAGGGQPKATKF